MDCEFFRKLEEIIDGNPDPRVLDELRADPEWRQHLDQCETCRRVMDDVWKPLAHLGTVTPPEPSQALKHRIAGQIEPNSRVFSALRPAIATAVVCIVFLAGYWVRDIRDPDVFPFESPRLLTGSGEDPSDPA
ncbi:MAG TPA: hypothetical protein PLV45_03090, partial [bacterium]|nr:hypothetical protein [bacterium]